MKKIVGWSASLYTFFLTGIISLILADKTSDESVFHLIGSLLMFMGLISFVFLIINMYKKNNID